MLPRGLLGSVEISEAVYDAVKSCRPVELTFHEPVSREICDGLAGTLQRTAVVPAKAPVAARVSLSFSQVAFLPAIPPTQLLAGDENVILITSRKKPH